MHTFITRFLDFLFPLSCAGCGAAGMLVCRACAEKLSPAHTAPDGVLSFFDYRDEIIRRGIWELKYRGKHAWAEVFGRLLNERLLEEIADRALLEGFRDPLVMPVPLAKKRLSEREYNQAALIAEHLSSGEMAAFGLARIRETPRQMEIKNRAKRLENVKDAFLADPRIVRGRNIIVLDDVATTGATLRACRDALVAAGAQQVLLVSVAH